MITNKKNKTRIECLYSYNFCLFNKRQKIWLAICFLEQASINNAFGFSFCEPKMIESKAKKYVTKLEDVSF